MELFLGRLLTASFRYSSEIKSSSKQQMILFHSQYTLEFYNQILILTTKMGNKTPEALKTQTPKIENFIQVMQDESTTNFPNTNPYRKRILLNRQTNELIDEYELQFASQQDYKGFVEEIQNRMEKKVGVFTGQGAGSNYVYPVKYFIDTSIEEMCSTVYTGLLYTKKVEVRLKQVNDIPFEDQLCLYKSTLEGFKHLYQKVGYFDISEELIFMDREGYVRVWMNPNLSKMYPFYRTQGAMMGGSEVMGSQSKMLMELISIIEENSDRASQLSFREYLEEKSIYDRLSFYKAIEQFHNFTLHHRLIVPAHMKSIYSIFHNNEEQNLGYSMAQKSEVERVTMRRQAIDSFKKSNQESLYQRFADDKSQVRSGMGFGEKRKSMDVSLRGSKYSSQMDRNHVGQFQNRVGVQKNTVFSNNRPQIIHENIRVPTFVNVNSLVNVQPQTARRIHENRFRSPQPVIFTNSSHQNTHNMPIKFNYNHNQPQPQPQPQISHIKFHQPHATMPPMPPVHQNVKINPNFKVSDSMNRNVENLKTLYSINSDNFGVGDSKNDFERGTKISYYSSNETFQLDKEIADDLEKYLGVATGVKQ